VFSKYILASTATATESAYFPCLLSHPTSRVISAISFLAKTKATKLTDSNENNLLL